MTTSGDFNVPAPMHGTQCPDPEAHATEQRAEHLAIYVDGEGDAWVGMSDGTVSCLERVPDGDRYARWTLASVAEQTTSVVKVWSPRPGDVVTDHESEGQPDGAST